jgi:hypothetical protein
MRRWFWFAVVCLLIPAVVTVSASAATDGAPTPSTRATFETYGSECTEGTTCRFRIGIAYCAFYNNGDGSRGGTDDTELRCFNMRSIRITSPFAPPRIVHRGYALITTKDRNVARVHRNSFFRLPGDGPLSSHASQYRRVASFENLAYNCRRYSDGATCTVPSDRYPGSTLAIFLTKRGGVWYSRIYCYGSAAHQHGQAHVAVGAH